MVAFLTNSSVDDRNTAHITTGDIDDADVNNCDTLSDPLSRVSAPLVARLSAPPSQLRLLHWTAFGGCFRCFQLVLRFIVRVQHFHHRDSAVPCAHTSEMCSELLCRLVSAQMLLLPTCIHDWAWAGRDPAVLKSILTAYPNLALVLRDAVPNPPGSPPTRVFSAAGLTEAALWALTSYGRAASARKTNDALAASCGSDLHRMLGFSDAGDIHRAATAVKRKIKQVMSGKIRVVSTLHYGGVVDLNNKIAAFSNSSAWVARNTDTNINECSNDLCWMQDSGFMKDLSMYSSLFIAETLLDEHSCAIATSQERQAVSVDACRPMNVVTFTYMVRFTQSLVDKISREINGLLPLSKQGTREDLVHLLRSAQFETVTAMLKHNALLTDCFDRAAFFRESPILWGLEPLPLHDRKRPPAPAQGLP